MKKISYLLTCAMMLSIMSSSLPVLASEQNDASEETQVIYEFDEISDAQTKNSEEVFLADSATDENGNDIYDSNSAAMGYCSDSNEEWNVDTQETYETMAEDTIDATYATSGKCGDNVTWSYDAGVLTLSGTGSTYDFEASDDGLPDWYEYKDNITSVVVNEGVTYLGKLIFYECTKIESVSLPDSLKTIGETAFYNCRSLDNVVIPDNVETLMTACFYGCSGIESIDLGNVKEIYQYAFEGCSMSELTIPKSVIDLSCIAFMNSTIEKFVVELGNSVYSSIDGTIYKDNGKTLYIYAPRNPSISLNIPSGVTIISSYAFDGAAYLQSITIPNTVTTLGEGVFKKSGLTSVVIPNSVTSVGDYTFLKCYSLEDVVIGDGITETSYQMFEYCQKLKNITFGKNLTKLGARTFTYCSLALTDVVLPAQITEIGNGCFGNCTSLKSFKSYSLKNIPYQAFLNCNSLTSVTLNEGMTDIYRYTFIGCYSLKSIDIPESVTFVHTDAFEKTTTINCKNKDVSSYGSHGYRIQDNIHVSGTRNYNEAYSVLEIVNKERQAEGLSPLSMNQELLEVAMKRAAECSVIFAHTRPDGSSCFTLSNNMYAENIAAGQNNASAAMSSWMNSSGHKANILDDYYESVGIGCFEHNGVKYWVQCFSANTGSDFSKPANCTKSEEIHMAIEPFYEAASGSGVVFNPSEYTYEYKITPNSLNLETGENGQFTYYIINPGFKSAYVIPDKDDVSWSSDKTNVATVDGSGLVMACASGDAVIKASLDYTSVNAKVSVADKTPAGDSSGGNDGGASESIPGGTPGDTSGDTSGDSAVYDYDVKGIYWNQDVTDYVALVVDVANPDNVNLEYSWYANVNNNWILISDWTLNNPYASWVPDAPGDYVVVAKVRATGSNVIKEVSSAAGYHPQIKGICQMPYTGEGGGYLIGFESYDNNNYTYEMLILDCTLLAEGKDAWVYSTGKCHVPDKCFWTIWQPQYGYYWTLFRIYDENGTLLDERCYGFENIC